MVFICRAGHIDGSYSVTVKLNMSIICAVMCIIVRSLYSEKELGLYLDHPYQKFSVIYLRWVTGHLLNWLARIQPIAPLSAGLYMSVSQGLFYTIVSCAMPGPLCINDPTSNSLSSMLCQCWQPV